MPTSRISSASNAGIYFITPTIVNWYYIFDRHDRWDIIANSLSYCQENKGLKIYAYVLMLNHIHLVVGSDDVAGFLRDFKRHTAIKLKDNLVKFEPRALKLFMNESGRFQFWKNDNKPKMVVSDRFAKQKIKYIHDNPVRKGYVERPEHWKWSSANPASPLKISHLI